MYAAERHPRLASLKPLSPFHRDGHFSGDVGSSPGSPADRYLQAPAEQLPIGKPQWISTFMATLVLSTGSTAQLKPRKRRAILRERSASPDISIFSRFEFGCWKLIRVSPDGLRTTIFRNIPRRRRKQEPPTWMKPAQALFFPERTVVHVSTGVLKSGVGKRPLERRVNSRRCRRSASVQGLLKLRDRPRQRATAAQGAAGKAQSLRRACLSVAGRIADALLSRSRPGRSSSEARSGTLQLAEYHTSLHSPLPNPAPGLCKLQPCHSTRT